MSTLTLVTLRGFASFLDIFEALGGNLLERLAVDLAKAGTDEPFGL